MGNSAFGIAAPFKGVTKQIAKVTVGAGGAASVVFSDIPQEYDSLALICAIRSEIALTASTVALRFNADGGANYAYQRDISWENSRLTSTIRAQTSGIIGTVDGATARASAFSPLLIDIPEYANTNMEKRAISRGAIIAALATDANMEIHLGQFHWNSAAAITSITVLSPGGADIAEHSTLTLYGIKEDPGGMNGPGVSVDEDVVMWDGVTGRKLQGGGSAQISTPISWSVAVGGPDVVGQGTWAIALAVVMGYVVLYNSTHNQNDNFTVNFRCPAGTYTLRYGFLKDSNMGKCKVYIDVVEKDDVDGYAAVQDPDNIEEVTGIVLTAGEHGLKFDVYDKHASSTNHYINLSYIYLQRTG